MALYCITDAPGFVSVVYVLILANPRLSCLVYVSIYCHFPLSPLLTLPPLQSLIRSQPLASLLTNISPLILMFLHSVRNFFIFAPWGTYDLFNRWHGCIRSKRSSGSIPPWLLQLTPFCLFTLQHEKKPNAFKILLPGLFWLTHNNSVIPSSCSSTYTEYLFISVSSIK